MQLFFKLGVYPMTYECEKAVAEAGIENGCDYQYNSSTQENKSPRSFFDEK